jgi:cytochrome c-type biogenesis protein
MIPAMLPQLSGLAATLHERPIAAIPVLFAAGLITSLTPCVYPMIPITAGILGGAGAEARSRRRTALMSLTYALGLALVYAALGLVAGLTRTIFGSVSANPWAYFAAGNLLLVFALAMLDVFTVSAPTRLLEWASRFGGRSYGGVFAMGATSGLVAAPCGAPAFGAVLTFVAGTGSAVLGFVYLFAFSLGMTALLIAVGIFSGMLAALPRAGRWTLWIKRASGILLLAMAEYYFIQMGKVS